jgi:hypothetical protein
MEAMKRREALNLIGGFSTLAVVGIGAKDSDANASKPKGKK